MAIGGRGFLFLLLTSMATSMEIPGQCVRDSDCSQEIGSSYCLLSLCERCLPCEEVLQRRSLFSEETGQKICAKTEDDCGVCLPGYQSEDLVDGRRSFKCYPVPTSEESFSNEVTSSHSLLSLILIAGIIVSILICILVTIWIHFFRVKNRQNVNCEKTEENRNLVDRLPPPYELPEDICSPVLGTERHYTVAAVAEQLNQATPIEPYHHANLNTEADPLDALAIRQYPLAANEEGNGSTETIPSLWEPAIHDIHIAPAGLPRCQSLEWPTTDRHRVLVNSVSDPTLPRRSSGSSYACRHIRLSMHRLSLPSPDIPQVISGSADQCHDDDFEPSEPQSFVYDGSQVSLTDTNTSDYLTHFSLTGSVYGRPIISSTPNGASVNADSGSQDSGFFDRTSRRRAANADATFELSLFIKRRRELE